MGCDRGFEGCGEGVEVACCYQIRLVELYKGEGEAGEELWPREDGDEVNGGGSEERKNWKGLFEVKDLKKRERLTTSRYLPFRDEFNRQILLDSMLISPAIDKSELPFEKGDFDVKSIDIMHSAICD